MDQPLATLAWHVFALVCVLSGGLVIVSRNPVHSVLWLILAFFNAAGLMVLLGAEFVAMILVIVYVGAIAVLFLFVVMMLDVDFAALRAGFPRYLPIGLLVGLVLLIEIGFVVVGDFAGAARPIGAVPLAPGDTNTHALGRVLYTNYAYAFQAAGLILLVAMIGAIVLTLRERTGVRRQDIAAQVTRARAAAIAVRSVPLGVGATPSGPAALPGPSGSGVVAQRTEG